MVNRNIIYIATVIIIVIIVSGAFIYADYKTTNQNGKTGITITDDENYNTTLAAIPQRIVSLAPSCTQILFAIGEGSKVVGVTSADDYPYNFAAWAAAGNMTIDGDYGNPNMEAIAGLRPDLIVTDSINDPKLPSMRSLEYNVIELNPSTVEGIYKDIALMGKATGATTEANTVIQNLTSTINSIATKIANAHVTPLKVFYEVWTPPLITAGYTTWINDVISKAGGVNIFSNSSDTTAYPTVSSEAVVALNPDAIFLPTEMGQAPFYGSVNDVKATPGWNTISAVQNNKIFVVNGDVFAEPGPRVADCVYAIASDLYPQLFNSTS
ncbi:MAG: cobalamin-binding protein [Candidatus Bathyarchaeia archaeon]|jgi:iron complex transport system substrate-binding protein